MQPASPHQRPAPRACLRLIPRIGVLFVVFAAVHLVQTRTPGPQAPGPLRSGPPHVPPRGAEERWQCPAALGPGRPHVEPPHPNDLGRYIACVQAPPIGRGSRWCAAPNTCADALPNGACPPRSPVCAGPLATFVKDTGATNQKFLLRNAVGIAAAVGAAFVLPPFFYRYTSSWAPPVLWESTPFGDLFNSDEMLCTLRQHACAFSNANAFSDANATALAVLESRRGVVAEYSEVDTARTSASWRDLWGSRAEFSSLRAGIDLMRFGNLWSAWVATTEDETRLGVDTLTSFPLSDWMRRAADEMIARISEAAQTARGSPAYIVLHLRVEQDVLDAGMHVPTPEEVVARLGELAKPLRGEGGLLLPPALVIAGGYPLSLDQEMQRNPHIRALCSGDGAYACILKSGVAADVFAALPPRASAFDVASLLDFEIVTSAACVLFVGTKVSTWSIVAVDTRFIRGLAYAFLEP